MTDPLDPAALLTRRAEVQALVQTDHDACGPAFAFMATVGGAAVSIPLPSVLRCIRLAEREHAIPALGEDWWTQVAHRYDLWHEIHHDRVRPPKGDGS